MPVCLHGYKSPTYGTCSRHDRRRVTPLISMLCSSVWHFNISNDIVTACLEGHNHSNRCYFILPQEWDCVKIHYQILALDGRLVRKTGWPSQEEHAQDDWPFLAWLQPAFHYMLAEIQAAWSGHDHCYTSKAKSRMFSLPTPSSPSPILPRCL